MSNTGYKNKHRDKTYDRIEIVVPKGMKEIIKMLAKRKKLSVNGYFKYLVHQDQQGMFDTLQIAEKNREKIRSINGNTHDGYDVVFTDGYSVHCSTKLRVRKAIISYLTEDSKSLTEDI